MKNVNTPTSKKNGTVLKKCTCEHEYQSKKYNGMRVMNVMGNGKARCTVCEKVVE